MSDYTIKEDYIGDLTDLEPKHSLTDSWEFFLYLGLALVIGVGIGVVVF